MLNVVIPMAGLGTRFPADRYRVLKPFIEIHGRPMIEWVLKNVDWPTASLTIITRASVFDEYRIAFEQLTETYQAGVVLLESTTEGPACTVLHGVSIINSDTPLLIANCDQYVKGGLGGFIRRAVESGHDGSILCFEARDPKWSYAELDAQGRVVRVREKEMISPYATVGVYFFRRGADFVNGAVRMLLAEERVNGEYYVAPVYNYLIRAGLLIDACVIPSESMIGLGTPADLESGLVRLCAAR